MKNWWPRPKKPDEVPETNNVRLGKYLQAWNLLKKIPIQKMFPAVLSVSTVVFLAVSGLVAWLVVFVSFVLRLLRVLT